MKISIAKLALIGVLLNAFSITSMFAQNANVASFWEQVDGKIINPPAGTPKSISEIRSDGTLLMNGTGAMLLLFGNRGLPANPVPLWSYVSNDGGKSWEYLTPFTKYNGYEISTYDISSSGKNFVTGSFNIGGVDGKQPVYFFSKDGKSWTATNKSDLLDKNYFGIGNRSIIEAKNRKLSDCLNLYPGDIGDYNAVYELHKIYYPDGSIKIVKDDKYDETKKSTNMANFYSLQSATGTYVRGNPVGDYQRIREAYYTCEGTYFASLGGGVSMVSNDDISYKEYTSGLFTSTPAMREKYFPICNALFGIGKVASNEIKLYVKTKGNDWEDTGYYSGVYSQPTLEPVIKYNPKTKRFYIFKNFKYNSTRNNEEAVLWESKKNYECDCIGNVPAPEENKINYGTTIITHDLELTGEPPIKDGDWAFQMALEILKTAENGTILRYNKITGDYAEAVTLGNGKKGEKILLFDWASESNNTAPGYSEAAADALFNSLLIGSKKGIFDLKGIHFIGHGRGTVVNTLASERLLVLQNNYALYKNQISIDQITNISPHDWGIAVPFNDIQGFNLNTIAEKSIIDKHYMLWCSDINDAHPDLKIEEPLDYNPNNGVIAWKGVFNDTYFQENGKLIEKKEWEKKISYSNLRSLLNSKSAGDLLFNGLKTYIKYNYHIEALNLNDRRVTGSYNVLWKEDEKGQFTQHFGDKGLYHTYTKTINTLSAHKGGGYQFSHLGKDKNKRPKDGYGSATPTFNFYNNITVSYTPWKDRIVGICNGSFDRETDIPDAGSAGWSYHGGYYENGVSRVFFTEEQASLINDGRNKPTELVHNRMYIPLNAQSISFLIKTNNVIDGELLVTAKDVISGKKIDKTIPIKKDIKDFVRESIDVTSLRDKVVTLGFSFKTKVNHNDSPYPSLDLDDVKLEDKKIDGLIVNGRVQTKQGSNLRLRAEPSDKSTILIQIPDGSKVHILEEDDEETTVNGEKGRWLRIEFGGQIGWAWGNFIKKDI